MKGPIKSPADARSAARLVRQRSQVRADLERAQLKADAGNIGEGIRATAIRRYLESLDERIRTAKHYAITGRS